MKSRIKYSSNVLTLSNVLNQIDGKNIRLSIRETRTAPSVDLLNSFIKDDILMPDIFISGTTVDTSNHAFNLILLNLIGEVNNIFFDVESGLFKTLKKTDTFPKNTMSLYNSLNSPHWFKIKHQMIEDGLSEPEAASILEKSDWVISKLFNSEFIIRKNLSMKNEDFFNLY